MPVEEAEEIRKKELVRVEFKAAATLISRAEAMAESLGLSLSAYIRYVMTEDIARRTASN